MVELFVTMLFSIELMSELFDNVGTENLNSSPPFEWCAYCSLKCIRVVYACCCLYAGNFHFHMFFGAF